MSAALLRHDPARPGYEACTGCNLCVLPCPVWHATHDLSLTLRGRAKAWQGGAGLDDIAPSLDACVVCGACEPVCPEGIDTVGRTLALRALHRSALASVAGPYAVRVPGGAPAPRGGAGRRRFLVGASLATDARLAGRVAEALGVEPATDDGRDLAIALEAGLAIQPARLAAFAWGLRAARELVVGDGLLHRPLRRLLPRARIRGVGEALLGVAALRRAVGPDDLFVIETRGFHADWERLVRFYDAFRSDRGCLTNLDLQRVAAPTGRASLQARLGTGGVVDGEQIRRILLGRPARRIVVEDPADAAAFRSVTDVPVVHLAELG